MVTDPVDEPFFREWLHGRACGAKRSKVRAQVFLEALLGSRYDDLMRTPVPLVVAVGSKGKGTTAAYSSAALAAAGLRVGTVTSPGFRSHRERIRVDGQSITPTELAMLAMAIEETRERHGSDLPNDGYLSPTGLFTMAGVLHFIDSACDAWVFEAGMGGRSDEVSLLSPDVVTVTPIFEEHVGILGRDVREIAVDKLGVVTERTSHVVTQPGQHPVVAEPHSRTTAELFRSIQLPGRFSVHHGRARTWVLDTNGAVVRLEVYCNRGEPRLVIEPRS